MNDCILLKLLFDMTLNKFVLLISAAMLLLMIIAILMCGMVSLPCSAQAYRGPFQKMFAANPPKYAKKTGADPGQPLFLTPYIEAGKIKQGD